ncbi:hypothetical protein [Brytella acorum]|uniref:Type 4 secretion system PilS N-terminal domain-containing protein n=1 Tax=Brytella acorum TaxID=2959299 RepID=A0AA35UV59_9PROT|nr:hypothetical protein [Brytella acorum]MDF3623583.1 hypothetical protein [Brytella acorum]CAI9119999.1 hypothetical protein LMG32879_000825 [Brytella acorum]
MPDVRENWKVSSSHKSHAPLLHNAQPLSSSLKIFVPLTGALCCVGLFGATVGLMQDPESGQSAMAASEQTSMAQAISVAHDDSVQGFDFYWLNNRTAIEKHAIPSAMLTGDGETIRGPWPESRVLLRPSGASHAWIASWTGIPLDACPAFADGLDADHVNINGFNLNASRQNVATQIATLCQQAPVDSGSSIELTYIGDENGPAENAE